MVYHELDRNKRMIIHVMVTLLDKRYLSNAKTITRQSGIEIKKPTAPVETS